ncbi:LLM class flavin-dependent oxidoreductase [Amycolatopsis rhabdoformis]|uniref:LLM class flavin-dependent oxidoreductase n=1 Tax=Amycolatopsis rhabdoformis TaxID=1448059 RepID=A0ABZ1HUE4_9PSEU|nr:LLM class flavin-dependent oxidoreductase [Amycolatopsis rhabdoformis]WSE26011.1 LLM class flavin-dependent oxidoreductase [Amycolatopsis rhabdoformis]
MADFGRDITTGYFLVPNAADPLVEHARELERLGFDHLAVQDHPYQRRYVETFALLGVLLGATAKIRVFPDVANLPLRNPAVLAKAAASLDLLSGGRFDLAVGAGAFWDAIEAYGGPRRSPGEALAAEEEALTVIRKIWSGEHNLRFDGRFHTLAGAHSGPVPARPIGLWLGSYGPRALRLTGRLADGWVVSLRDDPADVLRMTTALDTAAVDAGRDPATIRRVLNVGATPTAPDLTDFALGAGFDTFVLSGADDHATRTFVNETIPQVREEVAAERTA